MPRSLSSLIADDMAYAGAHVLAWSPDGPLTWQDFLGRVRDWQTRLKDTGNNHVAVQLPDAWEFLSCLWAIWRLGKTAMVSASAFRDIPEILPSDTDNILGDNDGEYSFVRNMDLATYDNHSYSGASLILFTSGSTGKPQLVAKTLEQLDAEIVMINELWEEFAAGSMIINMVSHHHMYGLQFGLLWPVVRGMPFYSRTIFYADPLECLAQQHRLTLVTSPVQLENLPNNLDWPVMHDQIAQIFSGGAPLNETAAESCRKLFGKSVTEVYGSTETGVVARREQPHNTLWQCLPGIKVENEEDTGQLRIYSPALAGDHWLTMADMGNIDSPTSFSLEGRIDRIVKIGGKRVSLTGIESALASHPWIRAVKVFQLPERKYRICAVVVLTAEGNAVLIDKGRPAVNRILTEHIEGSIERIALPRYWRYVHELPVNSQGKTSMEVLSALFLEDHQPRLATVINREELVSGGHYQLTLQIPGNLYYFSGHFPGRPVLPGVVQTHWAIHYARELFPDLENFRGFEALKFQHIIQTDAVVTLDIEWRAEREKVYFSYRSAQNQHSSGRILFDTEAHPGN